MEYKLSDEDARIYISLMFEGYLNRKAEKRLYSKDGIPQEIINLLSDLILMFWLVILKIDICIMKINWKMFIQRKNKKVC